MKKLILTALAAMTATMSAPAMADKWIWLTANDDGDVFYLNASSLRSAGDNRTCWASFVKTDNDKKWDTSLYKLRINCTEETASTLALYLYKNGKVVHSDTNAEPPVAPPPGSFLALGMEAACFMTNQLQEAEGAEMATPNGLVSHAKEVIKELKNKN